MAQQGNFVEYGTGSQRPVQYGAQTAEQADQAWGQVSIAQGGALTSQDGKGTFSVVGDELRFAFLAPQPDDLYYVQASVSSTAALIVGQVKRAVDGVRLVLVDPTTGLAVGISAIAAATDVQLHVYRMA